MSSKGKESFYQITGIVKTEIILKIDELCGYVCFYFQISRNLRDFPGMQEGAGCTKNIYFLKQTLILYEIKLKNHGTLVSLYYSDAFQ